MNGTTRREGRLPAPAPVEKIAGASANCVDAADAVVISGVRANSSGGLGSSDVGVRRDRIVQVFKTNDPIVPNPHFRAHTGYDSVRICRKSAGVGARTDIQKVKAIAGPCATDTERPIEVIRIRSNDAETSTNAPQRIYAAVEDAWSSPPTEE